MQDYFRLFMEKLDAVEGKLSYMTKVCISYAVIWVGGSVIAAAFICFFRSVGMHTFAKLGVAIPFVMFGFYFLFSEYAHDRRPITDKRERLVRGIVFIFVIPMSLFISLLRGL